MSNISFEFLELLAAEHTPPLCTSLWRASGPGDLRVVRHGGEPLTVSHCAGLITGKRKLVESRQPMPASVVATYHERHIVHAPGFGKYELDTAMVKAMRTDTVDCHRLQA